ncbi:hypothetical protein [Tabrizicola sp. BL-A-41-H6]|uniref:hypothetical protein n=1 Tax=Tabrizicola sp. BL-A-41-H6 TaxID=3421107 RepID=UPI003D679349
MSEHDSTNSGVFWRPHEDQILAGQGKLNINGTEGRIVIIKEQVKRDGEPQLVMYQKIGVLFPNDKKDNERAPDFSGPLDHVPNHRVAGWAGNKDGRKYMSLKVSQTQPRDQQGGGQASSQRQQDDGWSRPRTNGAAQRQQNGQVGGVGNGPNGNWRSDLDDEIVF